MKSALAVTVCVSLGIMNTILFILFTKGLSNFLNNYLFKEAKIDNWKADIFSKTITILLGTIYFMIDILIVLMVLSTDC